VFHDLDATLLRVLTDPALGPPVTPADPTGLFAASKMFLTPDRDFRPKIIGETAVNLFLHRVKENRELRETIGFPEPDDPPGVRRMPLLRVDCSYLVTAWTKQAGEPEVRTEHKLLGLALQWLSRFPDVPAVSPVTANFAYLQGSLARTDLPLPVAMAAQMDPDRVPVDFWTGLGIAPRPSFDLTVTIPIVLSAQVPEGPPVVVREIDFTRHRPPEVPVPLEKVFRIGGTVTRTLTGIPIPAAVVVLVETGARATTNADGQFQFGVLPAGRYKLRVSVAGQPDMERRVNVPLEDGDEDTKYDFDFPI
jgi:hypothetical protein